MSLWIALDEITALELGKKARAHCHVPHTLDLFATHFPRFPVLPGVLVLESLTRLAIHLLQEETKQEWRVGKVEQVRFRHFVQPGDQMELAVEVKKSEADTALLSGSVQVEGRIMTTVRQIQLLRCAQEESI